ncbi:MAG: hypothetical protein JWQ98_752 [Chlorobi bacterium]|nr:hypothetical protein [Chlorobiota bacterium]
MSRHFLLRMMIVPVGLILVTALTARAQETQVPIDSAGTIQRINPELESKIALFPEYRDFQEARLYRLTDSSFTLEISYGADGTSQRERRPLTAAQVAELRGRVTRAIAERAPSAGLNQEGRARLLAGTTIMGLGYYGFITSVAIQAESGETAVALYMLGSASSFFIPYLVTSKLNVTNAQANLSIYGGVAGALHGVLLYNLINGSNSNVYSDGLFQGRAMASLLGGITESVCGYIVAGSSKLPEGKVDVIALGGTAGLGLGEAMAYITGFDNTSESAGMMLLGSAAGFAAGNAMANMQHYTPGDAYVLTASCAMSAYALPAMFYLSGLDVSESNGKIHTLATIAGGAAGLVLGHYLVKDHEFSTPHGQYIALGTGAGFALGLGVAYLISPRGGDGSIYVGSALVGGAGAFGLMYSLLQDGNRSRTGSSNLRFDISPIGVAAFALGRGPVAGSDITLPVATMQYRF